MGAFRVNMLLCALQGNALGLKGLLINFFITCWGANSLSKVRNSELPCLWRIDWFWLKIKLTDKSLVRPAGEQSCVLGDTGPGWGSAAAEGLQPVLLRFGFVHNSPRGKWLGVFWLQIGQLEHKIPSEDKWRAKRIGRNYKCCHIGKEKLLSTIFVLVWPSVINFGGICSSSQCRYRTPNHAGLSLASLLKNLPIHPISGCFGFQNFWVHIKNSKAKLGTEDNWKGLFHVSSGILVLTTRLCINLNSPHCISYKNTSHEVKDTQ